MKILAICYFILLAYITLFFDREKSTDFSAKNNFELFVRAPKVYERFFVMTNHTRLELLKQVGGNIIIFIPLPYSFMLLLNRKYYIYQYLIIIIASTLMIELLQFTFNIGVFDVDDLFLNTIGGVLGIIAFRKKILKKKIN